MPTGAAATRATSPDKLSVSPTHLHHQRQAGVFRYVDTNLRIDTHASLDKAKHIHGDTHPLDAETHGTTHKICVGIHILAHERVTGIEKQT